MRSAKVVLVQGCALVAVSGLACVGSSPRVNPEEGQAVSPVTREATLPAPAVAREAATPTAPLAAAPPVSAAPPSGTAASSVAVAQPQPAPECEGKWTRLEVTDAMVEEKEGKHVLTVKAKTLSHGWKVELRPLEEPQKGYVEYEVVGLPPEAAAGTPASLAHAAAEEKTVSQIVDLSGKSDQPVLVYGIQATIFAQ